MKFLSVEIHLSILNRTFNISTSNNFDFLDCFSPFQRMSSSLNNFYFKNKSNYGFKIGLNNIFLNYINNTSQLT